jgi:thymidylate synthase
MLNDNELEYLLTLGRVLAEGKPRGDRTGTGTRSMFALRMEFDLKKSFPLLTTKRVHFKSVVEELLWFLRGETNVNTLDAGIWDEWADESGELGPIYSSQWRAWKTGEKGPFVATSWASNGEPSAGYQPDLVIDQIQGVIDSLKNDPNGRRHIVSAWNPGELHLMALPPCHMLFQFYVDDGELTCQLNQRSADMLLGVPFNIASYALLTHIIAHYTGLKPGRLVWIGGDCHIYNNHLDAVKEQLKREIPEGLPQMALNIPDGVAFDELKFEHFALSDYRPLSPIKAEVAV